MKRIYCDNSATTRVYPEVIREMNKYFKKNWGNPSSIYEEGRFAKKKILEAKERVAKVLNCEPDEIYFTSGGSESDNLFIKGCFKENSTIITTDIEHPAVLNACKSLHKLGVTQITLKTNDLGLIDFEFLRNIDNLIKNEKPIYATVMLVNNETGMIQDIELLSKYLKLYVPDIIIHTDAVQAVGKTYLDTKFLGVDAMSLSGHKFGAPKGIGILYLKKGIKCNPLIDGGGQEEGIRSGTENVPYIMGITKALEITQGRYKNEKHREKMKKFDTIFREELRKNISGVFFNTLGTSSASGIINVRFAGVDAQSLLLYLDSKGISVSAGSACHSDNNTPSHVLKAMGLSDEEALSSLRFSFVEPLKKSEMRYVIKTLKEGIDIQRKAAIVLPKDLQDVPHNLT